MPLRAVDQMALDEQVIDDKYIEGALEERLKRRETASLYRAEAKQAHDAAMLAIERLELPDGGVARVGRFRITRKIVPAKTVSFEAAAKDRVSISLVDDK